MQMENSATWTSGGRGEGGRGKKKDMRETRREKLMSLTFRVLHGIKSTQAMVFHADSPAPFNKFLCYKLTASGPCFLKKKKKKIFKMLPYFRRKLFENRYLDFHAVDKVYSLI